MHSITELSGANLFVGYAAERWAIQTRRESGEPPPWSPDIALSTGRFTCVRREDDRVTRWIGDNWRAPNAGDPDLFFAMNVARFVNQPATLARIGYPVPWDPAHFISVLSVPNPGGEPLYNPAYLIRSAPEFIGRSKSEYLVTKQFDPLWARRNYFRPRPDDTLAGYFARLFQAYGMGGTGFMTAQVIADLKYVAPLSGAADWWTFAAPGPGSLKGLNAVYGLPPDTPWAPHVWLAKTRELYAANASRLEAAGGPRIHLQDAQNLLCEVSKVARGRTKTGFAPFTHGLPASEGELRARLAELTGDSNRRLALAGIEARYTPDVEAFVALWRKGRSERGRTPR
jgi:alpha-glutamyl/putrescinyl thymine pyrophosphorylase clade 1